MADSFAEETAPCPKAFSFSFPEVRELLLG